MKPLHRLLHIAHTYLERILGTNLRFLAVSNTLLTLNRVVGIGTGIFFTIACANLLSPETFGTYKYILASAGIIAAFSLSGLNTAITRAVAQKNDDVVWPLFKIGVIAAIPAGIAACLAGAYYLIHDNALLGIGFLLIGLTNPIFVNLGISKSIILGKEDHKTYLLYQGLGAAIPIFLLLAIILYTQDIFWLIVGYFVINTLSGVIIFVATMKKYHMPRGKADIREAFTFGSHMSVVGFFSQIGGQIDQLLLWHFTGPAAVAHYALALAPMRELKIILENLFIIILPRFARYNKETAKSRIPYRTLQFFVLCVCVTGSYIFFAPYIFKFLFPQYIWAVDISRVMALGLLLLPRGIAETYLTMHGVVQARYTVTIVALIVKIGLFLALIPTYNIVGAVIAILISDVVSALIILYYYKTH